MPTWVDGIGREHEMADMSAAHIANAMSRIRTRWVADGFISGQARDAVMKGAIHLNGHVLWRAEQYRQLHEEMKRRKIDQDKLGLFY